MNKPQLAQLKKQNSEKERPCFGTKEWSKSSGICRGCKARDDCGKMKVKNRE